MSSERSLRARELFLEQYWKKYPAFDREIFSSFRTGRVMRVDGDAVVLENSTVSVSLHSWSPESLRDPKAARLAPSVRDVLTVGDWIALNSAGETVLFAPCLSTQALEDSSWNRVPAEAKDWAEFLSQVRGFFVARGFLEMATPILAPSPGTEPFLDPLSVSVTSDQKTSERFLITSPEFHLKKALACGLPRIFEIARCFRNDEGGDHHRVEFHMLEWYRSFASLNEIADDVENLIRVFRPEISLRRQTMSEVFKEFAGFPLTAEMTRDEISREALALGVRFTSDDDFADIFHRVFLERIEPALVSLGPILISGYPPSMSALARIRTDGFADRFEVYWNGLELCNAFHELNDPQENRRRFEDDIARKLRSGRRAVPVDDELLRAFELGVPPAGGIALGVERLFMAIHNISDIGRVRPFLANL